MAVDWRTPLASMVVRMALLFLALFYLTLEQNSDGETLQFKQGDLIPLFANKVNRLNSTCVKYPYFDFPFCPPGAKIINKNKLLAEVLAGDCFTNTRYKLRFNVTTLHNLLCEKTLTRQEVAQFREAVEKKFEYELSFANIFFRGMVGKVDMKITSEPRYYLVTNIHFYPQYNHSQVRAIDVVDDFDSAVDITEDAEIKVNFTYSVLWKETSFLEDLQPTPEYENSHLLWSIFFWYCTFVIWGCMLYAVMGPHLRSYFRRDNLRYFRREVRTKNSKHFDIIRSPSPRFSSLLGAILGSGIQLLIMICFFFSLAFHGYLYPRCPEILCFYIIVSYCLTSAVSSYMATAFHVNFTSVGWKDCIFQTGSVYFVPALLTVLVADKLAKLNFGISDLPELGIIVPVFFEWGTFTLTLLILGGLFAYSTRDEARFVSSYSIGRIAEDGNFQPPWYLSTLGQMFLGGFLQFVILFLEMDEFYASLWNQKICGGYQTLLDMFVSIIRWNICVNLVFTYFHVYQYDNRWWWRSVMRGGSVAIYMFLYGIYFFAKTGVEGPDMLIYLGYNACIFYAFFLVLGTISFYVSSFVYPRLELIMENLPGVMEKLRRVIYDPDHFD